MKKILLILLILQILVQTIAIISCTVTKTTPTVPASTIAAVPAAMPWYSESANEFTITTAEQLAEFADMVNNGNNFALKTVKLGSNILLNETKEWMPIGNRRSPFNGTFDGNGFAISGVYTNNNSYYQGLFGCIDSSGIIKNLGVINSHIKGGFHVGGLVGNNHGTVSNSYFIGNVTGKENVGGLVGENWFATINSSYFSGTVIGEKDVGGIAGRSQGKSITNSYFTGYVTGISNVGGIAGRSGNSVINNNYSSGTIKGMHFVGGLIGYSDHSLINNSYSASVVTGKTLVGGLVGKNIKDTLIQHGSFGKQIFDGAIINSYYDNTDMQSKEFADNLNFVAGLLSMNAWVYSEGKYPTLSTQAAKANIASFFANGEGTEANPYIIETKEHLENFSFLAKMGATFLNKHFKLSANIMLNDTAGWQNWAKKPPANAWIPPKLFSGTFDGNGFAISGIYVNSSEGYQGMFRDIDSEGAVKNLGLTASYIKGKQYVGGLAGRSLGDISNSYFSGEVNGQKSIGGLAGYSSRGAIINSYSSGKVAGEEFVGGLAGENFTKITKSYSIGKVTGKKYAGGFVGNWHVGSNNKIRYSYYDMQTSGKSTGAGMGAVGKITTQMKQKSTYEDWDFDNIWKIDSKINNGYPVLIGMANDEVKMKHKYIWNTADTAWYNASQTEFTITTPEQLAGFAKLVSGKNNFKNKIVKLGANIMLNDTANWRNWKSKPPPNEWIPIGSYNFKFGGTFDGNGFVVSGVYINSPDSICQGLFGYADSVSTIKNLGVTASYIRGERYAGGLVGYNSGIISGSYSTSTVIVTGIVYIGGITGNNFGTINNSYSESNVIGDTDVGGLAGDNRGLLNDSYFSGTVVGVEQVGGIAGYNNEFINNSYFKGSVNGKNSVGGIVGFTFGGTINNSYSSGTVKGARLVGGLLGYNDCGLINSSFSASVVSGKSLAGGLVGLDRRRDCFPEGNIIGGYYDKQSSGQTRSDGGVGKATSFMKSKEFVDSLNLVAGILSMKAWVYSVGKYPVLSAQTAKTDFSSFFASGDGTEANPYIINTKEQLKKFSFIVNKGETFLHKYIKLGNNILLNDTANWRNWAKKPPVDFWVPPKIFKGTFDGSGFAISGVYIKNSNNYQGLFGHVDSIATIINLGVTASYIKGKKYIGGLAGNCEGIVGNSFFIGEVNGEYFVGGLFGYSSKGAITNSFSIGKVMGKESVGGFAGENFSETTNSYSASEVIGGEERVGGFMGNGFGGYYYENTSDSYYDMQKSGHRKGMGAIGKKTAEMKEKSTYKGWDFDTVWGISGEVNGGYPYLLNYNKSSP